MTQTKDILLSDLNNQGVLRLTLCDEKRRNALSEKMLETLGHALDRAANNPDVRVIVLAAIGPAFCAGHDLKEISAKRSAADDGQAYFTALFSSCANVMQAIVNNPKPAAGCQLVASCDLAVAADTARFATPGVNIGLFCSTPMVALSRSVSTKHAMEMLLTGDMISATRAEQIGLINRTVEPTQLTEETMALAAKIASKSTMTVAMGKTAFYQQQNMKLNSAYAYTSQIMVDNMLKLDAKEGISAFIEKRHPKWQDR
jgi:enoyl-CoA hydratase/carnithine racemase